MKHKRATVANESTPFYKRYPLLYVWTCVVLLATGIFIFKQLSDARAASELKKVTTQDIARLRPTTGNYEVSGGLMNYVYAQAEGFTNDKDKDTKSSYDSFVPYVDTTTKQVVMLVEVKGYSPRNLDVLRDNPPANVIGFFGNPDRVPEEIFTKLANRGYPVPKGTPVMEQFGGVNPAQLKFRNIMASIVAILLIAVPWVVMYLISRPKKRRKSFSERYPERRIY